MYKNHDVQVTVKALGPLVFLMFKIGNFLIKIGEKNIILNFSILNDAAKNTYRKISGLTRTSHPNLHILLELNSTCSCRSRINPPTIETIVEEEEDNNASYLKQVCCVHRSVM